MTIIFLFVALFMTVKWLGEKLLFAAAMHYIVTNNLPPPTKEELFAGAEFIMRKLLGRP